MFARPCVHLQGNRFASGREVAVAALGTDTFPLLFNASSTAYCTLVPKCVIRVAKRMDQQHHLAFQT